MASDPFTEIVQISNDPNIGEKGGGHNQKGQEFQKNWALIRMFSLEEQGAPDFLFLFEAIQDVAVLDSVDNPTKIAVYQVKKKDRKEWLWNGLTFLNEPTTSLKTTSKRVAKPITVIRDSPIGKLHTAVRSFTHIASSGCFVSNAGCDISMADGSNAATSTSARLDMLPDHFKQLLSDALATLHKPGDDAPDLSKLSLEKIDLPVDDPMTFAVGKAHSFLHNRSVRHAGQARSFVEGILATIGPLGAKTATTKTFAEMKTRQGFSRIEFIHALAALETVLDVDFHLKSWLEQLQGEGMGFMEVTSIRSAVTAIYRRQVMGAQLPDEPAIIAACDSWLAGQGDPTALLPFFRAALAHLQKAYPNAKSPELQAHFALRAIDKCVALN